MGERLAGSQEVVGSSPTSSIQPWPHVHVMYVGANQVKSEQLGMPFGTAANRLRQRILFRLVQEAGRDRCFVCEEVIEAATDLSIEHKKPWLHRDPDLFWDLDNVAFSHRVCNKPSVYHKNNRKGCPNGTAWCSDCKECLSLESFSLRTPGYDGVRRPRSYCRPCRAMRRREGRSY